jgi:hypothetical protein
MCASERPNLRALVENMKAPMPVGKKLFLFLRNSVLKIVRLRNCCGHPGDPGC